MILMLYSSVFHYNCCTILMLQNLMLHTLFLHYLLLRYLLLHYQMLHYFKIALLDGALY